MHRLLAICVIAACSSSTPSTKGNGSGSTVTPSPQDAAMTQSIYPADQLLAWLEQNKDKEVRLPVLVTLKPNKMNVATATVGDKPDALEIKAADNTMAVPIAGKWGQFCGSGESCMLLLEGVWVGGETKKLQVREVVKAIPDADRAGATSAELAK
ncbi:MAG: hypothetical protein M4D80_34205 [Myxococcota bacterium]|nr:hypothetical protein [Deltaproteobacteria bacterium]MDQ3340239.1 hypothetical protein [Myxococcota bacterium]